MTLENLVARFDGVIPAGKDKWSARCPAHEDRRRSLSILRTPDRLLVKCHAGCKTDEVVSTLGIRMSDLYFRERPPRLEPVGSVSEVVYPYRDEGGTPLFEVVRRPGKKFV